MKQLSEIIEDIKNIISNDVVYDKDVAEALGLAQRNLANRKKRNNMPYEEIIDFCHNNDVDVDNLLYHSNRKSKIMFPDEQILAFDKIMRKIARHVAYDIGNETKMTDKVIAAALEMPYPTFATDKQRNKVPYKYIIKFCAKRGILMNEIFCGQSFGLVSS